MKKYLVGCSALLVVAMSILSGCAATEVMLENKNLQVQTKMSATLFIDPIEDEKSKTFYLQVKNTSDQSDFEIAQDLRKAFTAKGFKLVESPKQAKFFLQINVLQVGKTDPSAAQAAVYKGYGMDGVALGAGTAYVAGATNDRLLVGAGILGGITSVVLDSVVKDVHYSVITDLQIKERLGGNKKSHNTESHFASSGTSGGVYSTSSEKSDWKIYQTRILSSANKVNLEFTQAAPELKRALVQSIAGIF